MAGFSNSSAQYLKAKTNDTLSFEWSGSHNVYSLADRNAFKNCDFSGAHLIGDRSPATIFLGNPYPDSLRNTRKKAYMHYFACKVPGHCARGQKLAVSRGDITF